MFKESLPTGFSIKELEDRRGMKVLSLRNHNHEEISKLTYSENPNIVYTSKENRDSNDYVFIEDIITPEENRNKGYASILIEFLVKKYKHKIIIANSNNLSKNIMKKYKVIDTK